MTWAQLRTFAYGVAVEITYQLCRPLFALVHRRPR